MTIESVVRARRAAGETLREIALDIGVSTTEVWRRQYGRRSEEGRPRVAETKRSFVVNKVAVGSCSSDVSIIPVSLSRNATLFEAA